MDLNEKDIAQFDALLDGQLSSSKQKELLSSLRSDPMLKEAFDEHKQLRDAFQSHGRGVLKSTFEGLTTAIPISDVKSYQPAGQRGWWKFFKTVLLTTTLAAIGFISFDLLSNKDMVGATPVASPSEYSLPITQGETQGRAEEPQRRTPPRQTQQVIIDTVFHTVIVSGDEKEIDRLIKEKVEELEQADPGAPIIIKKDGLEYDL